MLRLSDRLFRPLVGLYPPNFRRRFGAWHRLLKLHDAPEGGVNATALQGSPAANKTVP
jgi:hypothetical protein